MSVGAVNKQTGDRIPTAGMPAIDDALSATSTNPVQNRVVKAALDDITDGQSIDSFADVETALALKQDKTDNSLQTTDKTVVGAVNELKSGLTNVQGDVKLNTNDLTTPSRTKNVLPITVDRIKSFNTLGTWSDNTYTHNGIVFTINTDSAGNVVSINANGTAEPAASELNLYDIPYGYNNFKGCKLNGCTGGASGTFSLMASYSNNGSAWANETHEYDGDIVVNESYNYVRFSILIRHEASVSNKLFYPMIRLSTETDATFAPYIPSVESRIEAVESNLTSFVNNNKAIKANSVAWPSDSLVFHIMPDNATMYHLVVSYSNNDDSFFEAYYVIRGDSGLSTKFCSSGLTLAYDNTTNNLTVTMRSGQGYYVYRNSIVATKEG